MKAFVLAQTKKGGNERDLLEHWAKFSEVKDAHILFGEWDFIIKLDVENERALSTFILDNIRKLPEVMLTDTFIVAHSLQE